jgi:hypothetical protein
MILNLAETTETPYYASEPLAFQREDATRAVFVFAASFQVRNTFMAELVRG